MLHTVLMLHRNIPHTLHAVGEAQMRRSQHMASMYGGMAGMPGAMMMGH